MTTPDPASRTVKGTGRPEGERGGRKGRRGGKEWGGEECEEEYGSPTH